MYCSTYLSKSPLGAGRTGGAAESGNSSRSSRSGWARGTNRSSGSGRPNCSRGTGRTGGSGRPGNARASGLRQQAPKCGAGIRGIVSSGLDADIASPVELDGGIQSVCRGAAPHTSPCHLPEVRVRRPGLGLRTPAFPVDLSLPPVPKVRSGQWVQPTRCSGRDLSALPDQQARLLGWTPEVLQDL